MALFEVCPVAPCVGLLDALKLSILKAWSNKPIDQVEPQFSLSSWTYLCKFQRASRLTVSRQNEKWNTKNWSNRPGNYIDTLWNSGAPGALRISELDAAISSRIVPSQNSSCDVWPSTDRQRGKKNLNYAGVPRARKSEGFLPRSYYSLSRTHV